MTNVGIIGCGMMGRVHSIAYTGLENVNVKAVASLSREQTLECARLASSRTSTVAEILNDEEIEIVSICTPTDTHRDLVVEAARSKKHIFCEKPIARTLKDALEMVEVCKQNGVSLGVDHVVRFFDSYSRAKSLIEEGTIGKVVMARLYRGGVFPKHGWNNWFDELGRSGGVLLDLSIHDFDFLRTVLGEVESITARSVKNTPSHPGRNRDHALAILKFANGSLAHVEGSWAEPDNAPSKFATSFEFVGRDGMITYDSDEDFTMRVQTASNDYPSFSKSTPAANDPYGLHIQKFIEAVREERKVPVDGTEAIEALKISLAANRSAESGRPVKLLEVV